MTWFENLPYSHETQWLEIMMHPNPDLLRTTELNYEEWRDMLRPNWGLYTPDDPKGFAGRVRSRRICGFNASDISNNVRRCERSQRDVRLDGVDHYYAVFQIAGRSTIIQNENAATLVPGDVTLLDSARPVTYLNDGHEQWLSLQLPRRRLISHLGVEPKVGFGDRAGTRAGRALYQLILESAEDKRSISAPAEKYMQLALYDLLGALFVPSDRATASIYNDKLFTRICNIIKDRFADPDFGPCEVAIEAGISLRYLQKLFSQRNSTCSEFMYALRLDHAARLLHRRKLLSTGQPVSEVAYACGFRNYTNFARKFRHRFGHSPAAHAGDYA
ncbi:helix-turn-helix domain-containing protein [Bradyrhizobium sp. Pear77]|uniref:helix-turn-helix domain-containing protein n=1 Tax=Bradyrhizobium altum TaxID=1571202 RepID=UPI001E3D44E9|nr:helix-turn-helix domain-containing protein [Bradyrhizobium altum]MCC8953513.1 helix-turn-helix domain-containing protein [Bradyrhizobium altum]